MKINLLKTKIKPQKTREKSRGRSMVEMLGVLAIIGVLSIGGIQGYTIAMRRYRMNEILDTLEKYAISCYTTAHQKMLNDEVIIREDGFWQRSESNDYDNLGINSLNKEVSGLDDPHLLFIKSINSGDVVLLGMRVIGKQLCEMLVTATGTGSLDDDNQCDPRDYCDDCYYVNLHFMMN